MPNNYFQFKRFRVHQDRAAMKVGTDGVLLGAWARLSGTERHVLDVGTGTGLIALMAAQRAPSAQIDAVEIDKAAARQALENTQASPWPERLHVFEMSIQEFVRQASVRYDHIVSNPPFFTKSLKAPDPARSAARHTDTLSFAELAAAAKALLAPEGRFSVVYPTEEATGFEKTAAANGLYCNRRMWIRSTPDGTPKRVLMEFSRQDASVPDGELAIELARHQYSDEYRELTKDFYLHF